MARPKSTVSRRICSFCRNPRTSRTNRLRATGALRPLACVYSDSADFRISDLKSVRIEISELGRS